MYVINFDASKKDMSLVTEVAGTSLWSVVASTRATLLENSKRGYRVNVNYRTQVSDVDDKRYVVAALSTLDTKGRTVLKSEVWDEEPAKTLTVLNPMGGEPIQCRCGGKEFFGVGRSLDVNHWECTECHLLSYTLTETGMSA